MSGATKLGIVMVSAATVVLTTAAASAQGKGSGQFGDEGQIVISGERLMGFNFYKGTVETVTEIPLHEGPQKREYSISGSQFSFGTGLSATNQSYVDVNPNAVPRVGVDFFVAPNLSVGGNVGIFSMSGEFKDEDAGHSQDVDDLSGFVVAPRVGYQIPFNEMWGLWLRGGVTYFSSKSQGREKEQTEVSLSQINAEGMVNVTLVDGFGLMFGPVVDLGIAGSYEHTNANGNKDPDVDVAWTNLGVTVGLFGYL